MAGGNEPAHSLTDEAAGNHTHKQQTDTQARLPTDPGGATVGADPEAQMALLERNLIRHAGPRKVFTLCSSKLVGFPFRVRSRRVRTKCFFNRYSLIGVHLFADS